MTGAIFLHKIRFTNASCKELLFLKAGQFINAINQFAIPANLRKAVNNSSYNFLTFPLFAGPSIRPSQ
ncbi:hypothetical protein DCM91_19680 [Chitinophaga costaii]|nr:hypothetical protein DCM91_19680 [Chitinophaga costaii]